MPKKKQKHDSMKNTRRFRVKRENLMIKAIKTVIILAIITVLGVSIKNIFDLTMENRKLEATHKELVTEKDTLQEELKNVKDEDYIEEQARMQLRMVKPGEIIYILQDEKDGGKKEKGN